jgi:Flp pilus assembly protein TadG
MRRVLSRLRSDCAGSMVVEFALLAPILLGVLIGVLQVGVALQNYNAVRNISADVARYAVIAHQSGNTLNEGLLETYAVTHAQGAPYLLELNRVSATVTTPTTQRVTGALERRVTVNYEVDSFLSFVGFDNFVISYTAPIFLMDNAS